MLTGMRPGEEAATGRLLALLVWIPEDEAIADHAGEMGRRCLRSHPGADPVDPVIAATVERLGAELWPQPRALPDARPGATRTGPDLRSSSSPRLALQVPEQVMPLEELEKRAKGRIEVTVKARHRKRADGGTVSVITDPDGNRVELREPRPR